MVNNWHLTTNCMITNNHINYNNNNNDDDDNKSKSNDNL